MEVLAIAAYRSNYEQQLSPHLKWFSSGQLEEIHSATINVLERAGVRVDHDEALRMLKEAGCIVRERTARIPGWMVDEAIRIAPSRITVYNREGLPAMNLEANKTYYGSGSDLPFHLDYRTGKRRHSLYGDIVGAARLMDRLPNYDFTMSYGIPHDLPAGIGDIYQFSGQVLNCSKPVVFTSFNENNLETIIDIAAATAGSREELSERPFVILYDEPISPLIHTRDGLAKLFTAIEHGIPVIYTPGVVAGGTCPVTKAGTIVQMNAEALSGLVLAQLKRKGSAVIIGGGATPMEMSTTATLYGSPDAAMNYCAMTELARYYNLPNFTEAGCTNAPLPDAQAGMEAAVGLLLNQLCGANLVHDVGYLDGGKTGNLPFLVMCDDYIGAARYIGAGTAVNEDTLGVDTIVGVGPSGHFLGEEHTMGHFRKEIWQSSVFNRTMYQNWEKDGSKDSYMLACEKAEAILNEDKVNAPPEGTVDRINSILKNKIE